MYVVYTYQHSLCACGCNIDHTVFKKITVTDYGKSSGEKLAQSVVIFLNGVRVFWCRL